MTSQDAAYEIAMRARAAAREECVRGDVYKPIAQHLPLDFKHCASRDWVFSCPYSDETFALLREVVDLCPFIRFCVIGTHLTKNKNLYMRGFFHFASKIKHKDMPHFVPVNLFYKMRPKVKTCEMSFERVIHKKGVCPYCCA